MGLMLWSIWCICVTAVIPYKIYIYLLCTLRHFLYFLIPFCDWWSSVHVLMHYIAFCNIHLHTFNSSVELSHFLIHLFFCIVKILYSNVFVNLFITVHPGLIRIGWNYGSLTAAVLILDFQVASCASDDLSCISGKVLSRLWNWDWHRDKRYRCSKKMVHVVFDEG